MSGFLSENYDYEAQSLSYIDFDAAERLEPGGSTCDVYITRWQRRKVFVKRLKEEFRSDPLYLDALEKEYEIGVTLNYPALPTYLAFGRDYIVMEYIDGVTLAQMLETDDSWLSDQKNFTALLTELLAAVDYLHRHGIVHCDIKTDNVMVTANGYNPVLIDFDKCYTDAFNDTSGHPGKYGMPEESPGRIAMDFKGLGNLAKAVVEKHPALKEKRIRNFIESSSRADITAHTLKEALIIKESRGILSMVLSLSVVAMLGIAALIIIPMHNEKREDALAIESVVPTTSISTIDSTFISSSSMRNEGETTDAPSSTPNKENVLPEQLHEEALEQAKVLDKIIAPRFKTLNARLDRLIVLKSNSEVSSEQLLDSIRAFSDFEDECMKETWVIMQETFPGLTEREGGRILSYSKVFKDYKDRSVPELNEIGRIIAERLN